MNTKDSVAPALNPPVRILLGPGPSEIHPRVLEAMGKPTVGHLDPYYLELMSDMQPAENMFSEAGYAGVGFSIGCGVTMDLAKAHVPGSAGEYFWGGAASTAFWIDPRDDIAVVFMTQFLPSSTYPIRQQLRTLVYAALEE